MNLINTKQYHHRPNLFCYWYYKNHQRFALVGLRNASSSSENVFILYKKTPIVINSLVQHFVISILHSIDLLDNTSSIYIPLKQSNRPFTFKAPIPTHMPTLAFSSLSPSGPTQMTFRPSLLSTNVLHLWMEGKIKPKMSAHGSLNVSSVVFPEPHNEKWYYGLGQVH